MAITRETFCNRSRTAHFIYVKNVLFSFIIYSVPAKVRFHHDNFQTERAIVIKVVSRYHKVAMRYTMKPLTEPPGGKCLS